MHLGRSGEAYFVSEAPSDSGGAVPRGRCTLAVM